MSGNIKKEGSITVGAPSNIAFIKYWGKTGRQHPINPSISMTLRNCMTSCTIDYSESAVFSLSEFSFEGKSNEAFKNRIENYLRSISDLCPVLKNLSLSIKTQNTFPHSAGIASSASSFAAIGYALAHIENALGYGEKDTIEKRASQLARLGSGSACRSITGPYCIWGECAQQKSNNDHAVPLKEIHPAFQEVCNTVLLIDTGEKKVSSSAGHALMESHPYRESRIKQAKQHTQSLIEAMRSGNWQSFGQIIEAEALSLHALMMTSSPPVMLLAPNTLQAIERIQNFRQEKALPLYFTIDAGPNIHLIYPKAEEKEISAFIQTDLAQLCQNGQTIRDENGKGARVINAK